jgi:hypothetical protein
MYIGFDLTYLAIEDFQRMIFRQVASQRQYYDLNLKEQFPIFVVV